MRSSPWVRGRELWRTWKNTLNDERADDARDGIRKGEKVSHHVSSAMKAVARYTASVFGVEKPPILGIADNDNRSEIDILEAADCPQKGVTAYATIGLSEHPLMYNGKEYRARVELLGACGSAFPGFNRVIGTAAFCIINSKWFCAPGIIFPGVMDMYGLSVTMSDVYFAHPFLWGDGFKSREIGDRLTAWLLVVPVSKAESEFAKREGPDKLEKLFAERDIDIFNLNRRSEV